MCVLLLGLREEQQELKRTITFCPQETDAHPLASAINGATPLCLLFFFFFSFNFFPFFRGGNCNCSIDPGHTLWPSYCNETQSIFRNNFGTSLLVCYNLHGHRPNLYKTMLSGVSLIQLAAGRTDVQSENIPRELIH